MDVPIAEVVFLVRLHFFFQEKDWTEFDNLFHVSDSIKCPSNVFIQFMVVGEKHSFLNAAKYVDQESNAKEKLVTTLPLLEVICVLVMTLMDAWKM